MQYIENILQKAQNNKLIEYFVKIFYSIILLLLISAMLLIANYENLNTDFDTMIILVEDIMFSVRQITFIGCFFVMLYVIITDSR